MRAKAAPLVAVVLAEAQMVPLADGRVLEGRPGDWLITQGRLTVDLVGSTALTTRYEVLDPRDQTLPPEARDRLERTLGLGATRTPEDLITAVERLAAISIGSIHIEFTPGQLEEIKYRATKRGRTVEQELQAVVDRIKEELFWRS